MNRSISRIGLMGLIITFTAFLPVGAYHVGDRGKDIALIQSQLKRNGYVLDVDGIYGSMTARAVQQYQQKKGLTASGIVDEKTYKKLTGKKLSPKEAKRAEKAKKNGLSSFQSSYPSDRNYERYSKGHRFEKHDAIGDSLVSTANRYIGVPYVFGGSTPDGFDCSGFTSYVFSHNGITLPRMADEQYAVGRKIGRTELIPGDLVFFSTYEPGVSHAGIYVGDDRFISATTSSGIHIDSLNSTYWSSRYIGATRVR